MHCSTTLLRLRERLAPTLSQQRRVPLPLLSPSPLPSALLLRQASLCHSPCCCHCRLRLSRWGSTSRLCRQSPTCREGWHACPRPSACSSANQCCHRRRHGTLSGPRSCVPCH